VSMLDFPMTTNEQSSMPGTTNTSMGSMLTGPTDNQPPMIMPFTHS